jgi:uracil-DNA glycosylase
MTTPSTPGHPDHSRLPIAWEAELKTRGIDTDGLYRETESLYGTARDVMAPQREHVFRAFHETPLESIQVVILGLDPYPNDLHVSPPTRKADGLAFSSRGSPPQPALKTLLKEIDFGRGNYPPDGDLTPWARGGVLLLNSALTVDSSNPVGQRAQHLRRWRQLICQTVHAASTRVDPSSGQLTPTAFLLLGTDAEYFTHAILHASNHLILEPGHPTNRRSWPKSEWIDPFLRINDFLGSGRSIQWELS